MYSRFNQKAPLRLRDILVQLEKEATFNESKISEELARRATGSMIPSNITPLGSIFVGRVDAPQN